MSIYIAIAILLHVPYVQQQLGQTVANAVGKRIGTKVTVGRVDLGMLNRIIIDDVTILDQKGKTMMLSARIAAKIDVAALAKGRIVVNSAQLFSPRLTLYQTSAEAKPNFQFVLDSLASKDTTSHKPLDIAVGSFIMRHADIHYDRYDKAPTKGKLDINHLAVSDFNLYAALPQLTDNTLELAVRELSFKEQSGIDIRRLAFHFRADRRKAVLSDFTLEMPASKLLIPSLTASYRHDGKNIIAATVKFDGTIEQSFVTPADMAFILPSLHTFHDKLFIASSFSGTGTSVNIGSFVVNSPSGDINIDTKGWYKKQGARGLWYADVKHLGVSSKTIEFLSENLKGEKTEVPDVLRRLGNIDFNGNAAATRDGAITARGNVRTGVGNVDIKFHMDDNNHFGATAVTDGIDLKTLADNHHLGTAALNVNAQGALKAAGGKPSIDVKGTVSKFSYDGYTFSNIDLNATYSASSIGGKVSIDDPNIRLSADGSLSTLGKGKDIALAVNIDDICPQAINLSSRWGDARFSAIVTADMRASAVNDAQGTLSITDFSLTSSTDSCRIDHIDVEAGFSGKTHNIRLDSDFGHIDINGTFDIATLSKSFSNIVGSKLPTLPGLTHDGRSYGNAFSLKAFISSTRWMRPLLGVNLDIQSPLVIDSRLDDTTQEVALNANTDSFSLNDKPYAAAVVALSSPLDTLLLDTRLTKIMDNGDAMRLKAHCSAADNKLHTSLYWDNGSATKPMSGNINAIASFFTRDDNQKAATISIVPSHINIGDKQWDVMASNISYAKNDIDIRQFKIEHNGQHIIVNGRASDRDTDSLLIDLNAVDVEYVLNLVNFHSVKFDGDASGRAVIVAPFGKMSAYAKLNVNNFLFENGRMGVLNANVDWNADEKQIDIHAVADDGPEAQTLIDGYVSPSRNHIDLALNAQGTYIDFLHSFTKSFISDVTGHANGTLRLAGPLNKINLTGKVTVNKAEAMISPLNCRYYIDGQTIELIPNEIKLDGVTLRDAEGHEGHVSGSLYHKSLTRLSYNLDIAADNLLAYDFRDFGNNTFYGTVYGTGNVHINGRSGLFRMDVDITPRPGSSFTYNVSSPDALSNQDFIEWKDSTNNSLANADNAVSHRTVTPLNLSSDMYINFNINCTPDATIRLLMDQNTGDYITLNGDGVIKATYYDKGAFNMFGTYTVDHGTYGITIQNILKKSFSFNRGGTLVFGGNPFDAAINLQAVHTVNGVTLSDLNIGNSFSNNTIRVNCLMNIGGIARQPQVSFDIDMPTVSTDEKQIIRSIINSEEEMNQQVVYLLGIGKFYPQTNNNSQAQGGAQYSQTSLAMQSLLSGTISGQINSILGSVVKSNNWNFGANISTGDEGWNNAEYEGLLSGRLLNNRLLINGQFGYRDNAAKATQSFIGDFDIRYLLTPNGNLALKVYNQTNDRYFTKSSLNTQGVGIIMKKDFTTLRDLFGRKKKKTAKKSK